MLGLATDFPAPEALTAVRAVVRRPGADAEVADWSLDGSAGTTQRLPATLFIPASDPPGPVEVALVARFGKADLLRREATVIPPADRQVFLRMALVTRCLALRCGPRETCIEGRCAPRRVDSAALPDYVEGDELRRACESHSRFVATNDRSPLPLDGVAACDRDRVCIEGTCSGRWRLPAERVRFAPVVSVPVDAGAWNVAAADFNADGHIDLALTHRSDILNGVTVLPGRGDGTVGGATFLTAPGTFSMALGDVDLDGYDDIVHSSFDGAVHKAISRRGTDGSFGPPVISNLRPYTTYPIFSLADFNRDGLLDLVVTAVEQVDVYPAVGDGAFKAPAQRGTARTPFGAVVADLDGDGRLDLVVGSVDEDGVFVYRGAGDGTLGPPRSFPTGGQSHPWVAVGDLNEDGVLDLVAASYVDNIDGGDAPDLVILLGDGAGGFGPPTVQRPSNSEYVELVQIADVDGDDHLDALTSGWPAISVYRGVGDGTLLPEVGISNDDAPGLALVTGDLDEDGRPDIVSTHIVDLQNPTVAILLNRSE